MIRKIKCASNEIENILKFKYKNRNMVGQHGCVCCVAKRSLLTIFKTSKKAYEVMFIDKADV